MPWLRLDDQRALNRKLRRAGFAARGLDEAAICQVGADLTDGHIDRATVEMLAVAHGEKRWERLVQVLVDVGRWEPDGTGWQIHDEQIRFSRATTRRFQKAKITRQIRAAVLAIHGDSCKHCGSREDITMDHIRPESRGGRTVLANLQPLCRPCNSRKGTTV